jgi:hypothetical protein
VNLTKIGLEEEVDPEAEVEGVDVVVEVDLDTRADLEWVIIHLDLLEMAAVVVVGITDHMVVPLPLLRHTDHTHHPLKPLMEVMVIQDYHQTPTQEVEDLHHPQHMVMETRTRLLQRPMVGMHHHLHQEVDHMAPLRLTHMRLPLLHVNGNGNGYGGGGNGGGYGGYGGGGGGGGGGYGGGRR